jgi:phospholipid/cholesterol/gamma-HCH transport system substrate-binding protein
VTDGRHSSKRRLPNYAVGLIAIFLVIFGLYLAFTKQLPFVGPGYQVKGVFRNAQNIAIKSPVRIAGVNVGTVTDVQPLPSSNAAEVTMQISDAGRPIHEDARIQLRPRLFLEGNLFADVHPGSPSSPEAPNGFTFPIQQTSNSVQLDQVLTTLQSDVRGNLQLLLQNVGDAFQKYGGAEGLREFYLTGGPANKYSAQVNEALLGTQPHDLSHLIVNFDKVAAALNKNNPQLRSLVTNFSRVTGDFAVQSQALQSAVHELPGVLEAAQPVFTNLNASFPFVRAFAREALPGVRSSGPALTAATPYIAQLRGLVSKPELLGLSHDLTSTVPQLAKLTNSQIPFMKQARALSSCFNNVIIPWSNSSVQGSNEGAAGKVYQETGYGLVGIGGESRSGDANGQYIRVEAGGGVNTPQIPGPLQGTVGKVIEGSQPSDQTVPFVGFAESQILGSQPNLALGHEDSVKPPFRPDAPCENQQPPNLETSNGPAPKQVPPKSLPLPLSGKSTSKNSSNQESIAQASANYAKSYVQAQQLSKGGKATKASTLMGKAMTQWLQARAKSDPQLRAQLDQKSQGSAK